MKILFGLFAVVLVGCSSATTVENRESPSGGDSSAGASTGGVGASLTGGANSTGGAIPGGSNPTGGIDSVAGMNHGGADPTGGVNSGGAPLTGGANPIGGIGGVGGVNPTGGVGGACVPRVCEAVEFPCGSLELQDDGCGGPIFCYNQCADGMYCDSIINQCLACNVGDVVEDSCAGVFGCPMAPHIYEQCGPVSCELNCDGYREYGECNDTTKLCEGCRRVFNVDRESACSGQTGTGGMGSTQYQYLWECTIGYDMSNQHCNAVSSSEWCCSEDR